MLMGICFLLSSLFSCQQSKRDFKTVPVKEFASLIEDASVQRLDVRTMAEYSEGHIPGTININVLDDSFAVMADSTLQKDKPVALYCRSGKRSKKAAAILSEKGYKVYELDKGFNAWQEAGEKVEK
ncbi:rhodanese-like domain protein [Bacteroides fragilis str. 3719 A10]|nr:rhodanese-like domain protein [Bacteroides fragilis str. 3719 A10]